MNFPDQAELSATVQAVLRETSDRFIMPRYRRLMAAEIREKTPGEVVTIADAEAELAITEKLLCLIPNARVIGEEACSDHPELMRDLATGTVWLVDPLDGTANFAAGSGPFGMMVALARDGIVLGAWIYHPVSNIFYTARLGKGAFLERADGSLSRLSIPPLEGRPVAAMATQFMSGPDRKCLIAAAEAVFDLKPIPRCAAEHYPRLCHGTNHVAVFQRTLPWDHAAGALLLREAGGSVRRWDGSPYEFHDDRLGIVASTQSGLWPEELSTSLPKSLTI